jgi:hypothetical protein
VSQIVVNVLMMPHVLHVTMVNGLKIKLMDVLEIVEMMLIRLMFMLISNHVHLLMLLPTSVKMVTVIQQVNVIFNVILPVKLVILMVLNVPLVLLLILIIKLLVQEAQRELVLNVKLIVQHVTKMLVPHVQANTEKMVKTVTNVQITVTHVIPLPENVMPINVPKSTVKLNIMVMIVMKLIRLHVPPKNGLIMTIKL